MRVKKRTEVETGHFSLIWLNKVGEKPAKCLRGGRWSLKVPVGELPFGHFFSEEAVWLNVLLPKWQRQKKATSVLLYVCSCSHIKHIGSKNRAWISSWHPQLILLVRKLFWRSILKSGFSHLSALCVHGCIGEKFEKKERKKKEEKKVLNISQTVLRTLLQRWELICSYFPLLYADADLGGFVRSAFLISNLPFQLWLAPRFLHLLYIIQDPEVQIIIHFYLNPFAHCYLYPDLLHACVEDASVS